MLFLDNQHRLIEYAEMFRGTIDSASVYPREMVKEALALMDVHTLDHVIVAGRDAVSFVERGLI